MSINVSITNDMARIVGLIAREHPGASIEIAWSERAIDERYWLVTATDGRDDHVYIVDDEAGHWAPASPEDLLTAGA